MYFHPIYATWDEPFTLVHYALTFCQINKQNGTDVRHNANFNFNGIDLPIYWNSNSLDKLYVFTLIDSRLPVGFRNNQSLILIVIHDKMCFKGLLANSASFFRIT